MVFGGSPNPAGFSGFSEMLTDLANEIAMSDYSPDDYASPTVRSSHLEVVETEEPNAPFAAAIMPAFEVPTSAISSYPRLFHRRHCGLSPRHGGDQGQVGTYCPIGRPCDE